MKISPSTFLLLLFIITSLHGTTIHIPTDQPTIQSGIDAGGEGDTVLVQPGVYTENVNFNGKNIVVSSFFLTTTDTAYITQTVIDGGGIETVVIFEGGEDSTASLVGFTITNGAASLFGGGIFCQNSDPILLNLHIKENDAYFFGGGIYCRNAHARLENLRITDNTSSQEGGGVFCMESTPRLKNVLIRHNKALYSGGGLACWDSDPYLEGVSIFQNSAMDKGGGVSLTNSHPVFHQTDRCNIYLNHASSAGNDLYASDTSPVSVSVDTLTVLNSNDSYLSPIGIFHLEALHGKVEPVAADLYVSPAGDDQNSGITALEPLRTITRALHKVLTDSLNPRTLFIADGIYTPSTGEFFPLKLKSHVTLSGTSRYGTILDAAGLEDDLFSQNNVLRIDGTRGTRIENMTITGGYANPSVAPNGGGIYCRLSDPRLENLLITGNRGGNGGGISFTRSAPHLTQVTVAENDANSGGGIHCEDTDPVFSGVTIENNTARTGGGMTLSSGGGFLDTVTITGNQAEHSGGGLFCDTADFELKNSVISTNTAGWGGGGVYCRRSAPYFERTSITQNQALYGGGMYCTEAEPYLVNATFSSNDASCGGAVECADGSHPTLVNSILWDDDPQEVYFNEVVDENAMTVYYSDIENGRDGIESNYNGMVYWMAGNIDADPVFSAPQSGTFDLSIGSPCIDEGVQDMALVYFIWSVPETVYVPSLAYIGSAPNLGAWEGEPGCIGGVRGDANGDGRINVLDALAAASFILGDWVREEEEVCRADCNKDSLVNVLDVLGIVNVILGFGTCAPD